MKQVNFSIQLNGIIFLTSCFVSMIIMLSSVCISLSVMLDSATPWSAAPWTPWSMGFSRQGYWSGLPFTSPRGLANLGIELGSPALQADSLPGELPGKHYMEHNLSINCWS